MASNKKNNKPKQEKQKTVENKPVNQQINNKKTEAKPESNLDSLLKNPIVIISGIVTVIVLFILSLLIINAIVSRNNNVNNNQVAQDSEDNNSNTTDNTSNEETTNNEDESSSDENDSGSMDTDDSSDDSGRVSSINSNELLTTGHTRAAYAKAQAIKEAIEASGQWQATDYVPGDIPASPYTVQLGDTLWEIAEGHYGDPYQWVVIRDLNSSQIGFLPTGEQALIYPGQVFTLR